MSFFEFRNQKIFYEEYGEGKPLLLLHGNTASGKMFMPLIPSLAREHKVVVMDFLGCGRSDRLRIWPTDLWYDWGEQAFALCKYRGYNSVNVIGCSGGALAGINLALEHPTMINALIADSFEGIAADPDLTEQIRFGRDVAKKDEGFCAMLQTMHGDDWETVLDRDTAAVVRHAETIGRFFHRPFSELRVRTLLTGSAQDDLFPKGHYNDLFRSICGQTRFAACRIFEHGAHPAVLSNAEAAVELCSRFFYDQ